MTVLDEVTGARLTMRRRLRWNETDAAGHNHFSSAVRWLEESEHALWRELGLVAYVPRVPRVHLGIDYRARVWFDQPLEVTVGVIRVGETSCTFGFSAVVVEGSPTTRTRRGGQLRGAVRRRPCTRSEGRRTTVAG